MYTKIEAMQEAVLLWENMLEYVKSKHSTTLKESRNHAINNLPKRFKRYKNHCPYCQYIYRKKGNADITSRDCEECIGVKEQAFGYDNEAGKNLKCFMMGSHFSACCNETSEKNVEIMLNKFKQVLKDNENTLFMATYTEKQAKEDAVKLWQAILEYVKDETRHTKPLSNYTIEEIKSAVCNQDLPERFANLENHCSYCEFDKKHYQCNDCIGVVNNVFGDDRMLCSTKGSYYYPLTQSIKVEDVEKLLKRFKQVLKEHKDVK